MLDKIFHYLNIIIKTDIANNSKVFLKQNICLSSPSHHGLVLHKLPDFMFWLCNNEAVMFLLSNTSN